MIKFALVTCSALILNSTTLANTSHLQSLINAKVPTGFAAGGGENGQGPTPGAAEGFGGAQNTSQRFKSCEIYAQMQWVDAFGSSSYLTHPTVHQNLVSEAFKLISEGNNTDNGVNNQKEELAIKIAHQMLLCEAYRVSTDAANYDYNQNYEEFEGDRDEAVKSKFGAMGLECANQPTPQAKQTCMMQAQQQEPVTCSHAGPETHDFLQCKRIVNFMDTFVIGKEVMQVQQGVRAGLHQNDLQDELMQKQLSGEGVQITDAMGAQADSLQQQGNLAYEMAAFDAAKAGTLLTMINSFPKPSSMIDQCKEAMTNMYGTKGNAVSKIKSGVVNNDEVANLFSQELAEKLPAEKLEDYCIFAISTNKSAGGGDNKLFMNQKIMESVKSAAMKAGLEAVANGAKGMLLHDQAGLVKDAMKDIEEFAPPEFPVAEQMPETASECLVNPDAEGCIAPSTPGFEGFRDGGFNANIGGSASLGTPGQEGNLNDQGNAVAGATNRDLLPEDFGVIEGDGNGSNDFVDGAAAPGSIKAGQVAGGGGGGVGGGGGGGGFGGGGGADRKPAGEKPSGKRDIDIKTKGSGLAAVGGRGRIGGSRKKPANPFSKLLGKKGGKGNGTLNFRGPAQVGGKNGSIFQMISNRYDSVAKKDRLLKYEMKK